MAKISKVILSIGKTINLGNYESLKVEYGIEADIDDLEDLVEVNEQIQEEVLSGLAQAIKAARRA